MYKVRNKKIALMTALVFVMTLVLPMGAAFGASDVDVTTTTATVEEDSGQELGYIKIDSDDVSAASAVYVDVSLPSDVEFDEDVDVEADIQEFFSGADAEFTYGDEDEFSAVLTPNSEEDGNIYIKFDTNTVTVDSSAADEIEVTLDAKAAGKHGGTAWEIKESYVLGQKQTGDITASADDPEVVKFGSGKEIATITVEEAYSGQFSDGDVVSFELPDEFKWEVDNISVDDITTKYGLSIESVGLDEGDEQTLVVEIADSTGQFAGSFELDGIVTVLPDASEGDVEVDVTSEDNEDFDSADLVVATVGESDVTVETDEDTGMEDYMTKASVDELWEITFETNGEFSNGDNILLELPDGFEFVKTEMEDATVSSDVYYHGLYDDNQGLWLEVKDDITDDIVLSDLHVAALPDCEYGDIEVDISGDVVETSVVAGKVKPAVTIETEVNKVEPGLTELAGNVTFTETEEDSLENSIDVYFGLPSGVEFADEPTVEVNGEELDGVTVVGEDDDMLKVTLEELDKNEVDTIVMSDIQYVIDSRFGAGHKIELSVGGQHVDDMFNTLDLYCEKDEDTGEVTGGQFEDEYDDALVKVANAVVQEAGTVEASFTLGDEGVAVQNGRTLVQVNKLCDVLGLQKSWDASSKTAYFVKDGTVVAFPIDQNKLVINGNEIVVDQGGTIINNYTYATLRGIQMAFGGDLDWDNETKTATFNFKK